MCGLGEMPKGVRRESNKFLPADFSLTMSLLETEVSFFSSHVHIRDERKRFRD
jgi:hypothetical protein